MLLPLWCQWLHRRVVAPPCVGTLWVHSSCDVCVHVCPPVIACQWVSMVVLLRVESWTTVWGERGNMEDGVVLHEERPENFTWKCIKGTAELHVHSTMNHTCTCTCNACTVYCCAVISMNHTCTCTCNACTVYCCAVISMNHTCTCTCNACTVYCCAVISMNQTCTCICNACKCTVVLLSFFYLFAVQCCRNLWLSSTTMVQGSLLVSCQCSSGDTL